MGSDAATEALLSRTQDCRLVSYFAFEGWPVTFRTNSAVLKQQLDHYYRHFAASAGPGRTVFAAEGAVPTLDVHWEVNHPEPGKRKVKEHVGQLSDGSLVRKIQTGVHLAYLGEQRLCVGPLTANPNQVINFINNVYLDNLLQDEGQLFHAAGVCLGQTGLGLAGKSGQGKSTLALHLLEQGMDLVSNDRLVVADTGSKSLRMRGVPKYPRINPGTVINQHALLSLADQKDIDRYRAMPTADLWDLEEKYDAPVEDCFPGCHFRLAADLALFVLLDWEREGAGPCRLERVEVAEVSDLVPAVMKTPGVLLPGAARRIPKAEPADYAALLGQTELFVLRGGVDFAVAAQALKALIARQPGQETR